MRLLIACEFSGVVRDAFTRRWPDWDVWSCDLLPTERPGKHIQGDVLSVLNDGWDLMIAHPPCTHLAVSGARWFAKKNAEHPEWQREAIEFFMALASADIPFKAIENPVGIMSRLYRKPDQIIQPWQFGHNHQKATCLWLTGLPLLTPTEIVDPGEKYVDPRGNKHGGAFVMRGLVRYANQTPSGGDRTPPGPERWKIRSRTFTGIASAMAEQWGLVLANQARLK